MVNGLSSKDIHVAIRASSLPSNGSLVWFFLGEETGQVKFPGRAQDIGGKEGTNQFQSE